MSRNYELLQQVEFGLGGSQTTPTREAVGVAGEQIAPTAPITLPALEPTIREETLKLVQRVFLSPGNGMSPRVALFAAIDSNRGCNWLCTVAANLLARSVSGSVCLVEGDVREPAFCDLMGMGCERGLIDSLEQDGPIREFARPIGPDNLWLLPAGRVAQASMTLLNSGRMKERFSEIRSEFDYVVMNAPPLGAFADGMALGRLADGVVLVLEANATRREAALRVTESLRATSIPVLGAVLNNRTFPIPSALYKRI
jgi:polysaccharide biosynthesis transport protein